MCDIYVVVGLGALGSGAAYHLAKAGHSVLGLEQFELGHERGASHDTSHPAAQLPHARLRRADVRRVRRLGHARGRQRQELVTPGRRARPVPAGCRRSTSTSTRARMAACEVAFDELDRDEVQRRWPQFVLPDGTVGLYQERGSIVPAARGGGGHAGRGAQVRRRAARPVTGHRGARPRRRRDRVVAGGRDVPLPPAGRVRRRLDQPGAGRPRLAGCPSPPRWSRSPTSSPGRPGPLRGRPAPAVDLDGRPDATTASRATARPTVKAAEDCGGARSTGDDRPFEPDPERLARLADFMARRSPARGRARPVEDLPVHADPRPRLPARAGARATRP